MLKEIKISSDGSVEMISGNFKCGFRFDTHMPIIKCEDCDWEKEVVDLNELLNKSYKHECGE
jgi:hypothetical protein